MMQERGRHRREADTEVWMMQERGRYRKVNDLLAYVSLYWPPY
jgi:hypothetical protein